MVASAGSRSAGVRMAIIAPDPTPTGAGRSAQRIHQRSAGSMTTMTTELRTAREVVRSANSQTRPQRPMTARRAPWKSRLTSSPRGGSTPNLVTIGAAGESDSSGPRAFPPSTDPCTDLSSFGALGCIHATPDASNAPIAKNLAYPAVPSRGVIIVTSAPKPFGRGPPRAASGFIPCEIHSRSGNPKAFRLLQQDPQTEADRRHEDDAPPERPGVFGGLDTRPVALRRPDVESEGVLFCGGPLPRCHAILHTRESRTA